MCFSVVTDGLSMATGSFKKQDSKEVNMQTIDPG